MSRIVKKALYDVLNCEVYPTGAENDGGQQPKGHAAAADRGQDDPVRRQGRGRQDLLRGVLQRGGQH